MDSNHTNIVQPLNNFGVVDYQSTIILAGSTVLVIIFSLLYFFIYSNVKKQLPVLMIVGNTQVGKTTLTNQLLKQNTGITEDDNANPTYGNINETFNLTVMSQDIIKFIDKRNNLEIIEFPGHFKLRYKIIEFLNNHIFGGDGNKRQKQMKNSNLKILLMIDSTLRDWNDDCKLIIDILEIIENENMKNLNIKKGKIINLLIACNKNESFTARPINKIKEIIENDIDEILQRSKKSITEVEDISGKSSNNNNKNKNIINNGNRYGGDELFDNAVNKIDLIIDKKFKFDMLETEVEFIGGSAKDGKIDNWLDWINN